MTEHYFFITFPAQSISMMMISVLGWGKANSLPLKLYLHFFTSLTQTILFS